MKKPRCETAPTSDIEQIVAEARDKIQAWQAVSANAPGPVEDAAIDAIIAAAIDKVIDVVLTLKETQN